MIKDNPLGFESIKPTRDGLSVTVFNNDIESAVRRLHRKVVSAGIMRLLKSRGLNPKRSDRTKAKAARAARHRARRVERKAASDARDSRR